MIEKMVYEADDGTIFGTAAECKAYEERELRKRIMNDFKLWDAEGKPTDFTYNAWYARCTSDEAKLYFRACYLDEDVVVSDEVLSHDELYWDKDAGEWKPAEVLIDAAAFMQKLFFN